MDPLLIVILLAAAAAALAGFLAWSRAGESARLLEKTERGLREEIAANRDAATQQSERMRKDLADGLLTHGDSLGKHIETLRGSVQERLEKIQAANEKKLDQMRETVDEKLQSTLEKRLSESFSLVSQRLEAVQKGLGEMHALADGVGDLKRLLTNVKTRGTWGELQLKTLVSEMLTKEQYEENVRTKEGSKDNVEIAIKLPGKDGDGGPVWLPVDAKFPMEDYQALLEARDRADAAGADAAAKQLFAQIKVQAKKIHDTYINPPSTTDFGILYLPVEGLYAEVMQARGLGESIQRDLRIMIAGPSTLAAFLNSLQLGFRTLAVEKKSSEVWVLLGTIKNEVGKFGDLLDATQKKLQEAGNKLDDASRKSRTIAQKLSKVQELPAEESRRILGNGAGEDEEG